MDKKVESRASLSNVSVLNAAAVPFKPARPRIALNIGLSAIIGALLGRRWTGDLADSALTLIALAALGLRQVLGEHRVLKGVT